MQIKGKVAEWLQETGVVENNHAECFTPDELTLQQLEWGHFYIPLIKRLRSLVTQEYKTSFEHMHKVQSPASKLHNWKLVIAGLEEVGVTINEETKGLIMAGDYGILLELIDHMHDQELHLRGLKPLASQKKSQKTKVAKDGALYIESIDPNLDLLSTSSCLEFLIVSLCKYLRLEPKQSAGLLTQNNKYLAHVVVKGLKGNHQPIESWFNALCTYSEHLMTLVVKEFQNGSLDLVLQSAKPGLLTKNSVVAKSCCGFFTKAFKLLNRSNLEEATWEWFIKQGIKSVFVMLNRVGDEILDDLGNLLCCFRADKLYWLVINWLGEEFEDKKEFLEIQFKLFFALKNHEVYKASGILDRVIEILLREGDQHNEVQSRSLAVSFLGAAWVEFENYLKDQEDLQASILNIIKRATRDKSSVLKITAIAQLFTLLSHLYNQRNSVASVVFKSLTFLLVENYSLEPVREFVSYNFLVVLDEIPSLPVQVIIEPLAKQHQLAENVDLNLCDFDLFLSLARHPCIDLEGSIQLLDILVKVFLNNSEFSKAALSGILCLVGQFCDKKPFQDYFSRFSKVALGQIVSDEKTRKHSAKSYPRYLNKPVTLGKTLTNREMQEVLQNSHFKNVVLDLVTKCINFEDPQLNEIIKNSVLSANHQVKKFSGTDHKDFSQVLQLLGDPLELIADYEQNFRALVPYTESSANSSKLLSKPNLRASIEIQKTIQRRQNKLLQAERQQRMLKTRSQKILKQTQKELSQVKASDGYGVVISEEVKKPKTTYELVDLDSEPQEEVKLVSSVLKRYSKAFKTLFHNYGFAEEQHISSGLLLRLLRDHGVTSYQVSNSKFLALLNEYCTKQNLRNPDLSLNYKGFLGFLVRISDFLLKDSYQRTLPIHYKVVLLVKRFAEQSSEKPEMGSGDPELVTYMNKELQNNSDLPIPPGYKTFQDYEFDLSYTVPTALEIPESQTVALETLDSILHSALGVHCLEPQVKVTECIRVKGLLSQNSSKFVPLIPPYFKADPIIKYTLAFLSTEHNTDLLVECGKLVNDLVYSVECSSDKLISQSPLPASKIINSVKQQRNQEAIQNSLQAAENKRRKRQKELAAELGKLKAEKDQKTKEETLKQKKLQEKLRLKQKKQEEEKKQELETNKKKLEEWHNFKQQEEHKKKQAQELELSKRQKEATKKVKLRKSKIDQELKEINKPQETESSKPEPKKINILKKLEKQKQKRIKEQQNREALEGLFRNPGIREVLSEFSQSLSFVFTEFCKTYSKNYQAMDYPTLQRLAKFFLVTPGVVPKETLHSVFRSETKHKDDPSYLDFQDFENVLVSICVSGLNSINTLSGKDSQEASGDTLKGLLEAMKLTQDYKQTKSLLHDFKSYSTIESKLSH